MILRSKMIVCLPTLDFFCLLYYFFSAYVIFSAGNPRLSRVFSIVPRLREDYARVSYNRRFPSCLRRNCGRGRLSLRFLGISSQPRSRRELARPSSSSWSCYWLKIDVLTAHIVKDDSIFDARAISCLRTAPRSFPS